MNEIVTDFKTRFYKALSIRNIKPSALSEKTGISKSTISHYMSGYTKPKSDKLFVLAKALNVNESWLMGRNTSMEREQIITHITPELVENDRALDDALLSVVTKLFSQHENNEMIEYIKRGDFPINIKADLYNQIIHHLKYNPSDQKIDIYPLVNIVEENTSLYNKELGLINKYRYIDNKGKHTVDTVLEMEYIRCKQEYESSKTSNSHKQDKHHIKVNAAHQRTDIEATEEMKKHDDAFFDE